MRGEQKGKGGKRLHSTGVVTLKVTQYGTYSTTYFSPVSCLRNGELSWCQGTGRWDVTGCHSWDTPLLLCSQRAIQEFQCFLLLLLCCPQARRYCSALPVIFWGVGNREAAWAPSSHHMYSHCFSRFGHSLRALPGKHDTHRTAAPTLTFHDVSYSLAGSQLVVQAIGPHSLGPTNTHLKLFPQQLYCPRV